MLCINTIEDTLSRYILLAKTKSGLEGINLRSELPFEVKLSEMREVKYLCQTCLSTTKKRKGLLENLKHVESQLQFQQRRSESSQIANSTPLKRQ